MTTEYILRYFNSCDGIHKVAMYTWLPEETPYKGIVQIIHGMREHMGRYRLFAAFLCSQGFVVCGHDHLGHGLTAGSQEDFGYFGEEKGVSNLLGDCKKTSLLISREYPEQPLYLLGHSMGSFLGRLYIVKPPVPLAGFICMGTGGELREAPASRAMLELAAKTGGRKRSAFLNELVISPERVARRKRTSDWLSRDAEVVAAYDEDPLTRPLFTNRGICDLISMQMAATSREWAAAVNKELPILLMSGDCDVIGRSGKGVVQTYERLQLAGCRDVQCALYEDARHELLNELNKEEIYYDIFQWIQNHKPM